MSSVDELVEAIRQRATSLASRAFEEGVKEGYERAGGPLDEAKVVDGWPWGRIGLYLVRSYYGYTVRVSNRDKGKPGSLDRGEVDLPLDLGWGMAKAIQDAIYGVMERAKEASEATRIFHQPCGDRHKRSGSELELSFVERWQELNRTGPEAGKRWGILHYLVAAKPNEPHETDVTQRDATVAATVIRWLGTPVGYGFLMEVLEEHGLVIKEK